MRYADLSPSTQLLLVSLVAVASIALFTRAIVFFYREKAGIRPVYPDTWSATQCRMLEGFRLLVGVALILLWAAFLFIAPSLPTNWPFGYFNFIIALLLISYAWALLLIPKNWVKFGAISQSFWITMIFLVVWWGAIFTATGWMLVNASASQTLHAISGVYASQGLLTLAITAS